MLQQTCVFALPVETSLGFLHCAQIISFMDTTSVLHSYINMQITLSTINTEHFRITEKCVNNKSVFLVQPQRVGVKFTQSNKIFRSSVWDKTGRLVSASWPKFTNWGENIENFHFSNRI